MEECSAKRNADFLQARRPHHYYWYLLVNSLLNCVTLDIHSSGLLSAFLCTAASCLVDRGDSVLKGSDAKSVLKDESHTLKSKEVRLWLTVANLCIDDSTALIDAKKLVAKRGIRVRQSGKTKFLRPTSQFGVFCVSRQLM